MGYCFGGLVICPDTKRVLLVEPANHYQDVFWTFPKGHQDPDETSVECAIREVYEETGFFCETLSLKQINHEPGARSVFYFMTPLFRMKSPDNNEVQSVRWADVDEAERLLSMGENSRYKTRNLGLLKKVREYISTME